jgi:large subunit ribosomal protein L9
MDIILLEKVENLGDLGDQVKVKPGFGRNFLIPSGKAVPATKDNVEYFEKRRAELEAKAKEALDAANAVKEKLDGMEITITAKAGDEGKLFGSVTNTEIADAISANGVTVEKRHIRMPEGPIRIIGNYDFVVHLHTDVDANIKVVVEAE